MIAVIRIRRRGELMPEALVTIPGSQGKGFYWWFGPSWDNEPYEIVHTYPDDADDRDIVLHFYRTFNVPQPIKPIMQSAGWIAPDGKWFPCKPWEHDSLADRLAAIYCDSTLGTVDLEKANWRRVYDEGLVSEPKRSIQAQIDTMGDLLQCSEDAIWQLRLTQAINAGEG